MPRISTYSTDETPNPTDRVIGSDGGSSDRTKNFLISDLDNLFGGSNFTYSFNVVPDTNDPLDGEIQIGRAGDEYSNAGTIKISKTDRFGYTLSPFLEIHIVVGATIQLREINQTDSGYGGKYTVNAVSDETTYLSITVDVVEGTAGPDGSAAIVNMMVIPNVEDDLGNHTATEDLDLATFDIVGVTDLSLTGNIITTEYVRIGKTHPSTPHNSPSNVDSVAIGEGVLFFETYGRRNIAIGNSTLTSLGLSQPEESDLRDDNVAIGNASFNALRDGSDNVAIGSDAGRFDGSDVAVPLTGAITLNKSIFIGKAATPSADDVENEIVIGAFALGIGSNTAQIGTQTLGFDSALAETVSPTNKLGIGDWVFDFSGTTQGTTREYDFPDKSGTVALLDDITDLSVAGMGVVVHGATAATARPTGYAQVTWIGTVDPDNKATNDIWYDTTP